MKKIDFTKKHFGMALARMNMPVSELHDFLNVPQFDAIEVPAECFEQFSPEIASKLTPQRFEHIHCGGLLEYQLTRNIPLCGRSIQDRFISEAVIVLNRLAASGIGFAALEFAMNDVLGSKTETENVRYILKKLAPVLREFEITLLLPFRIPVQSDSEAEAMMKFLRDSLVPDVKVRLDIHSHALPRNFTPEKTAGLLRYETKSLMFVYDADSGNRLMPNHVIPWISYMEEVGVNGPFLVSPQSHNQRMSLPESDFFARFVSELRTR